MPIFGLQEEFDLQMRRNAVKILAAWRSGCPGTSSSVRSLESTAYACKGLNTALIYGTPQADFYSKLGQGGRVQITSNKNTTDHKKLHHRPRLTVVEERLRQVRPADEARRRHHKHKQPQRRHAHDEREDRQVC